MKNNVCRTLSLALKNYRRRHLPFCHIRHCRFVSMRQAMNARGCVRFPGLCVTPESDSLRFLYTLPISTPNDLKLAKNLEANRKNMVFNELPSFYYTLL